MYQCNQLWAQLLCVFIWLKLKGKNSLYSWELLPKSPIGTIEYSEHFWSSVINHHSSRWFYDVKMRTCTLGNTIALLLSSKIKIPGGEVGSTVPMIAFAFFVCIKIENLWFSCTLNFIFTTLNNCVFAFNFLLSVNWKFLCKRTQVSLTKF